MKIEFLTFTFDDKSLKPHIRRLQERLERAEEDNNRLRLEINRLKEQQPEKPNRQSPSGPDLRPNT